MPQRRRPLSSSSSTPTATCKVHYVGLRSCSPARCLHARHQLLRAATQGNTSAITSKVLGRPLRWHLPAEKLKRWRPW